MKYTHLSLCLFLAVGSIIYCSNTEKDPFKAGKVYDKNGSYIYIERPWLRPNDIIINQWYHERRPQTVLCLVATFWAAIPSGYLAFCTLQGKKIDSNDASIGESLGQMGLSIGLGLASVWLARKTKSLMKAEDDGRQAARAFAAVLKSKVLASRHLFDRIEFVESKYILSRHVYLED